MQWISVSWTFIERFFLLHVLVTRQFARVTRTSDRSLTRIFRGNFRLDICWKTQIWVPVCDALHLLLVFFYLCFGFNIWHRHQQAVCFSHMAICMSRVDV